MGGSQIRGDLLYVNGAPFHLRGGEFHYFRLPKSEWKERLQKARECSLNTVSSYMPWYHHEPEEGNLDLTGKTKPERDLKTFLELCGELDLKVIARPGPFVNSELRCGGIPEWLFRNHPETMSRRSDGNIATGRPIPAEGEPLYRRYVRRWYSQVVPLVAQFDIHRGGPVILFQPDNELSAAWSFGLLNSLYDPTILGSCWPDWLKETYGDITVINDRYGTKYKDFKDVEPPGAFAGNLSEKRRCIDWMNFKRRFFADWGATMAKWAIEDGVQVPITFNEPVAGFYGHGDHAGFGSVLKKYGIKGFTTCHTYSDRLIDLEGTMNLALGIEITKSSPWGGPAMSVEMNTSWYIPRMSQSEMNWENLLRVGLGRGLTGSVVYPFTAGTVSFEDLIDGPAYWEPSCLDLAGNRTEAYRQLERFYRFVGAWEKELADAPEACEITIGYTPGQRLLDFLGAPPLLSETKARQTGESSATPGGESFDSEPKLDSAEGAAGHDWLDGYEGVSKQTVAAEAGLWKKTKEAAMLFTRLNVGYDLLELTAPNREPGNGWIAVPCTGSLDKEAVSYLVRHLDAGGGCLFFPTIPVYDLDGNPDRRLADRLGVRLTGQIRPAGGQIMDYGVRVVDFGDGEKCGVYGWIFKHSLPAGIDAMAEYEGAPVIARLPADKGNVMISGIDMSFTSHASIALWESIIRNGMKIDPVITTKGNYNHALLRRGKEAAFLTVMNLTGRPEPGTFTIRNPIEGLEKLTVDVELTAHEARCLVMGANLNGKKLICTTSEMIPVSGARDTFELHGHCGTRGEIIFAEPVSAELDGKTISSKKKNSHHVISCIHGAEPLIMRLK